MSIPTNVRPLLFREDFSNVLLPSLIFILYFLENEEDVDALDEMGMYLLLT